MSVYIPKRTIEELSHPHGIGERHAAMIKIAMPLIGNQMPAQQVFDILRGKFPDADKTDREIKDVIEWCAKKNPTPSTPNTETWGPKFGTIQFNTPEPVKKRSPEDQALWWTSGQRMTVEQFVARSQLPIPEARKDQLMLTLESLYEGADHLNIVCDYLEDTEHKKARPLGGGKVLSRDKWVDWIRAEGVPQSKAGAWVRPNPCQPAGTGKDGAITDSDIVSHRYLLVESDVLALDLQLALFSRLKLPISVVITSGGLSAHAWVRLDAKSDAEFSETSRRILSALAPFGIDQANKNPSRLSRLPGAVRQIGGSNGGVQKLLWLNPARRGLDKQGLQAFEESLKLPAIDEKPFAKVVNDAICRYDDLVRNGNRLGVHTGIAEFDLTTGGLQPGQMTVIAAETNGGKTSLALNFLYNALKSGRGAALFTLEMMNDEIVDIFFSLHCAVDRNLFNTGKFSEDDQQKMVAQSAVIAGFKLFAYDESSMTVEQIRQRVLALRAEDLISLAVVDYGQIVTPESLEPSREQQVAKIARGLCACAKDARIPMIVLSQLNDDLKLRESRVLAHEAHNVILIENKEAENKMIMKVVKGRRIQKRDYELYYEPKFCRITSASKISDENVPRYQPNAD